MNLILASASPRRKDILREFGYCFDVIKSEFNETFTDPSFPAVVATGFAKGKAEDVFFRLVRNGAAKNKIVLGADTVVCFGGRILGKPADAAEAEKTLKELSGNTHTVITGYAVIGEKVKVCGYDVSFVKLNVLSDELIHRYVLTGAPLDKAGSYGVQDGFGIVEKVTGSVYNVIGLPIEKVKPVLDFLTDAETVK